MKDWQVERYTSVFGTNQKSSSVVWEVYMAGEVSTNFFPHPHQDHIDFSVGTGPDRGLLDQMHFDDGKRIGAEKGWGKSRFERKLINDI